MPIEFSELVQLLFVGLIAGCLGGLLGIGGSIVMIPAIGIVLGRNQHLAQAAAMIVNLFVAVPSLVQHQRAGAVRWDVVRRMLPFGAVLIIIGVETSNVFDGQVLKRVFGVFLLYVILTNVQRYFDRTRDVEGNNERAGWMAAGSVGSIMGFAAGLLGIGGGGIAVPLLQRICRLPLRQCIATSTAVMCITAGIGAFRKNAVLHTLTGADGTPLGLTVQESLLIAGCLAPTAIVGGLFGATLTHRLPLGWVRAAFILLMIWASANMLGVGV